LKECTTLLVSAHVILEQIHSLDADDQAAVALRPTNKIVVPTMFETYSTTFTAVPIANPFSKPVPETSKVQTETAHTTVSSNYPLHTAADSGLGFVGQASKETSKATGGGGNNIWPPPLSEFDIPETTNALSILEPALASAQAALASHSRISGPARNEFEGPSDYDPPIGEQHMGGTLETEDPAHHVNQGLEMTPESGQAAAVWTHGSQSFTAVMTDDSAVIHGDGAEITVPAGDATTFKGQAISVPFDPHVVEVNGASITPSPIEKPTNDAENNKQAPTAFTTSGQTITATLVGSSVILQAVGTYTTIVLGIEVNFAGHTVSLPSPGNGVINVNGEPVTFEALDDDRILTVPTSAVWTHDGETFTAKMQGDSTILVEAPSTTINIAPGSTATLDDAVINVLSTSGVLVHDGTSFTLGPASPITPTSALAASGHSNMAISAFDLGRSVVISAGDKTFTLSDGAQTEVDDRVISVEATGGAIVIDGSSIILVRTSSTPPASAMAISAFDLGSSVVVVAGDRTFTLVNGARIELDGRVISVEATGGAIVLDGTTTIAVSTPTSAAGPSAGSSSEVKEDSTSSMMTGAENIASANFWSMQATMALVLLSLAAIAWI
jgi:hypothetical protein